MQTRDPNLNGANPDAATMSTAANMAEQLDHGVAAGEESYTAGNEAKLRDRQPKGDHNRRLALGLEVEEFAAEAGITPDQLREYEQTWPDHDFDLSVADRIGAALERLERNPPLSQKVDNGPTA